MDDKKIISENLNKNVSDNSSDDDEPGVVKTSSGRIVRKPSQFWISGKSLSEMNFFQWRRVV